MAAYRCCRALTPTIVNPLLASVGDTFDILVRIIDVLVPYIIAAGVVVFILGALELLLAGNEDGEQESGHKWTHMAMVLVIVAVVIYALAHVMRYFAHTFEQLL